MNKILVIAAYPMDELLGVGASVRRLVDEGAEAHAVILDREPAPMREKKAAALGQAQKLLQEKRKKSGGNPRFYIGGFL